MQIARHLPTVARIVYGLLFFVFGLNGFLGFMPTPAVPENAGAFLGALAAAGYMFPLIKGVEVLGGALLLANRLVPLALVLLAPVVVNIVAFHVFLAPPNPLTLLVLAGELYLAWVYRAHFRALVAVRAAPAVAAAALSATPTGHARAA
jgi:hypothetical protein